MVIWWNLYSKLLYKSRFSNQCSGGILQRKSNCLYWISWEGYKWSQLKWSLVAFETGSRRNKVPVLLLCKLQWRALQNFETEPWKNSDIDVLKLWRHFCLFFMVISTGCIIPRACSRSTHIRILQGPRVFSWARANNYIIYLVLYMPRELHVQFCVEYEYGIWQVYNDLQYVAGNSLCVWGM